MKARPAAAMAQRVDGWDLYRGIGAMVVVVAHAMGGIDNRALAGTGMVFLCVFFVLSGYLITHILMSDVRRYGKVRFGRFYTGRVVRLLPAIAAVLVLYAIAESLLDGTGDPVWATTLVVLLYVGNMPGARDMTGLLEHVWTLAFEEQFYLVWPMLLTLLVRRRKVVVGLLVLIGLSTLGSVGLALASSDDLSRLYTLPTTWGVGLLMGALLQVEKKRILALVRPATRAGLPVLLFFVAAAACCAATFDEGRPATYFGGMVVVAAGACVSLLWFEQWGTVRQWYLRPIVSLGVMTYGLYLWHYPICGYVAQYVHPDWLIVPLSVGLSILAAILSWYLIEQPTQNWYRARLQATAQREKAAAAAASESSSSTSEVSRTTA